MLLRLRMRQLHLRDPGSEGPAWLCFLYYFLPFWENQGDFKPLGMRGKTSPRSRVRYQIERGLRSSKIGQGSGGVGLCFDSDLHTVLF